MAETKKGKAKGIDPLARILSGERITIKKNTPKGEFEIVFPLPSDLRRIECLVSERLEGKPLSSFSPQTVIDARLYASLDICVIDGPEWYKELDSFEQCPDNVLVADLYRSYLRLYSKTQKTIANRRDKTVDRESKSRDDAGSVDHGAFSDITNGEEV